MVDFLAGEIKIKNTLAISSAKLFYKQLIIVVNATNV